MKSKLEKEFKTKNRIAEVIVNFRNFCEKIERFAASHTKYINEAAGLGENAYSDKLIKNQVWLEEFARELQFMCRKIEQAAFTAGTFGNIGRLSKELKKINAAVAVAPNTAWAHYDNCIGKLKKIRKKLRRLISDNGEEGEDRPSILANNMFDPQTEAKIEQKKRERDRFLEQNARAENPDDINS